MKTIHLFTVVLAMFMNGCSYFTINASMCDEIIADPHAIVPKECRPYSEEEATKAFNNTNKNSSDEEMSVEFNK